MTDAMMAMEGTLPNHKPDVRALAAIMAVRGAEWLGISPLEYEQLPAEKAAAWIEVKQHDADTAKRERALAEWFATHQVTGNG